MSDKIDRMFASDMEKLSMPSELALNAAKVKASQDPDKPGAEKPDLYAKGKGKGKGGKDSSEKNEERKSKGPNKGEKKDKIPPQFLSKKKDVEKEASGVPYGSPGLSKIPKSFWQRHKKKLIGAGVGTAAAAGGGTALVMRRKDRKVEKKASLDDKFASELSQAVGLDVASADPEWRRPDVVVEGQVNDAIDDHYVRWMREKADEDVVKEAGASRQIMEEVLGAGTVDKARKVLKGKLRGAALKGGAAGAAGTVALGAAGYGGYRLAKRGKNTGVATETGVEKQAGVQQNQENLDLLARIKARSEKLFGNA